MIRYCIVTMSKSFSGGYFSMTAEIVGLSCTIHFLLQVAVSSINDFIEALFFVLLLHCLWSWLRCICRVELSRVTMEISEPWLQSFSILLFFVGRVKSIPEDSWDFRRKLRKRFCNPLSHEPYKELQICNNYYDTYITHITSSIGIAFSTQQVCNYFPSNNSVLFSTWIFAVIKHFWGSHLYNFCSSKICHIPIAQSLHCPIGILSWDSKVIFPANGKIRNSW